MFPENLKKLQQTLSEKWSGQSTHPSHGQTDGQTDGRTDGRNDDDNTPPAIGRGVKNGHRPRGKKTSTNCASSIHKWMVYYVYIFRPSLSEIIMNLYNILRLIWVALLHVEWEHKFNVKFQ